MLQRDILDKLRHNFVVNLLDGAFFGFGMGFASFVTVIPLFVNSITDSTTIIGLISALHLIGWQLPQLFTASQVVGLRRFKPMVMRRTFHERWPFFGLAVVALLIPVMDRQLALALIFLMALWQSFGGGVTATAWQSMISKIIPEARRGTFFGAQSAAANLLAAISAVMAGTLLVTLDYPTNFAACFAIAGISMIISWIFLWRAYEPEHEPRVVTQSQGDFWRSVRDILRRDVNFRWFMVARILAQLSYMAVGFYTIYAVRIYSMNEQTAGVMTGVLLLGVTIANPLIGWMGDRYGHRRMLTLGSIVMTLSVAVAIFASDVSWFYVVFGLAGFAQAVLWTTTMAMTVEFGEEDERPYYIGLANTLTAPTTILSPILGGWLVDALGFHSMFTVAVVAGVLAVVVLQTTVLDPRRLRPAVPTPIGD
ncbi:MAG: MFS transporter [Anaerolineae bacterium]|nr:MFS transporter [Anaerolineae bacterium]